MNNDIFQAFGGVQSFMNNFENFKKQFGQRDPQQVVQQLLDSGQMTQQQFNALSQVANQIMKLNN